jgi:hypothetical protein
VVGLQPVEEIIKRAQEHDINHLYFGTSQSYAPQDDDEIYEWDKMIVSLLKQGFWCTLDFDVSYVQTVLESGFDEYNNFISMISVKIPYIRQFNYNATLKLDDVTWGHSNSGVWCHNLHELQRRRVYTDWNEYKGDLEID